MTTDHPFSLEGETVLITGGGSGLGLGMARCFVHAGAEFVSGVLLPIDGGASIGVQQGGEPHEKFANYCGFTAQTSP